MESAPSCYSFFTTPDANRRRGSSSRTVNKQRHLCFFISLTRLPTLAAACAVRRRSRSRYRILPCRPGSSRKRPPAPTFKPAFHSGPPPGRRRAGRTILLTTATSTHEATLSKTFRHNYYSLILFIGSLANASHAHVFPVFPRQSNPRVLMLFCISIIPLLFGTRYSRCQSIQYIGSLQWV